MTLTKPRISAVEPATSAEAIGRAIKKLSSDVEPDSDQTITIGGTEITVSGSVLNAVVDVLARFANQDAVIVGSTDSMLTTSRAAELAGVSRPYLCQLIDNGALRAEYVGTHRKVRLGELNAYLQQRRTGRREALNDLARISREAGQYTNDF
ncbi:helix-turn-helix domain-containing protein [Parafrigoribacterium mesophilum]|uniref:excisionase family DNA-binding protein n=1 Tax=Parafrigoribacterium mesophilum TaxID=433646 RepID=UPI0031FC047B